MDQKSAPLWEALMGHILAHRCQMHIPGHRSGYAIPGELLSFAGQRIFQLDQTEIPGLDDLHNPQGPIAIAQQLAAKLYGADETFFLVNGTSGGLIALILACCREGDKILIPRNFHRSILSGLIMSGAVPVYYYPKPNDFGCLLGPDSRQIEYILDKQNDIKAVLAINPTYYGVSGDLLNVAKICRDRSIPLLVDEAHGPHLKFHPELPPDALSCGAAAVVQSTHKMGGSLTQSSMLHLKGQALCRDKVADALRMVQSTSPSYILMASLDLARRQMAMSGREIWEQTINRSKWCREKIKKIKGVRIMGQEHLYEPGAKYLDPTRLTISLAQQGMSGYSLAEYLEGKYGVVVEMADYNNIVAALSLGTTNEDCRRLISSLASIIEVIKGSSPVKLPVLLCPEPVVAMTPREAWKKPSQSVALEQCRGLISAETISVYPPGIPALCPGEELTEPLLHYLQEVKRGAYNLQGPADASITTLRVVKE